MRIETSAAEDHGFVMKAEPGSFDGMPPLDRLVLGGGPLRSHPDRVGLAAFLTFGSYASGEFILPSPIGPELSSAIEDDCHPVRVRPGPVEYVPRTMANGRRSVMIRRGRTPSLDGHQIQVVPALSAKGYFRWDDTITVSSNSFAFGMGLRTVLAVAVLFAEDLDTAELRLDVTNPLGDGEEGRIRQLLLSVGLGFSLTST